MNDSMNDSLLAGTSERLGSSTRQELNGWIYAQISGSPADRGFQHGYWLAKELREALRCIRYLIFQDTGMHFDWFAANAQAMFEGMLRSNFGNALTDGSGTEIVQEMEGIVEGANARRGPDDPVISLTDIIGWNAYPEMICQWWPAVMSQQLKPSVPMDGKDANRAALLSAPKATTRSVHHFSHSCSSFIAVGNQTADGGIVAAQTTWQRFANGDAYNIMLDIQPDRGQRLLMQSVPGYVYSSTDFWVTGAGMIIAETSLNTSGFNPAQLPEFFRARRAGQYADSIDSWCDLFKFGNNGGYVNTWLLGDTRRNQIAAYELTLTHDILQPTLSNGYYASCNIPLSVEVRNLDQSGPSGYDNILASGGRRVRFDQLMLEHKGKIDAELAEMILADHHDLYLKKNEPSGRTICGHFDLDSASFSGGHTPYYPWGSLDGKVSTSRLAQNMQLLGRWGRACGTPLVVEDFYASNPQYEWLRGYMRNRPQQPWTLFPPQALS